MTGVRARGEEIRRFILDNIQANPNGINKLAAERFDVTRQAIHQQLARLVETGALVEKGRTRARTYALAPQEAWLDSLPIAGGPSEDVVWRTSVAPLIQAIPDNVRNLWNHAFTEMYNNALDHSGGTSITVSATRTAVTTEMMIADDGVGIFRKIQQEKGLLDESHAILELSKGKLTTDPKNHSGEGIFFTSRMCDEFEILSGGYFFAHDITDSDDWLLQRQNPQSGTAVFMKIRNHVARTAKEVYEKYTTENEDETRGFDKTVVPINLAQYSNDMLVSRSQAKRVLTRLEAFKAVVFNFDKVSSIGQAFADELFRVFPSTQPGIHITILNANEDVTSMIRHATAVAPKEEPASAEEGLTSGGVSALSGWPDKS